MKAVKSLSAYGFTLVELVVVMVVLGILSIGTVRFITDTAGGFVDTASRDRLASTARFALSDLSRELRAALPGSLRSNGGCVEFVPVVGASEYLSIPTAAPALSFKAVPTGLPVVPASRIAVAPLNDVYTLGPIARISPAATISGPDAGNEITVTFASAHQFTGESLANRFYLVTAPVSFCFEGTDLWRYSDYGFTAVQPGPAGLPGALPQRVLMAENVDPAASGFVFSAAGLRRNALVDITLSLRDRSNSLTLRAAAQVSNVP